MPTDRSPDGGSGGEFVAPLATTRREDGAARTGPHPQPEAMRLGPAPVVRLEGPLAHQKTPRSCCERGTCSAVQAHVEPSRCYLDAGPAAARHRQRTRVAVKLQYGTAPLTRGSNRRRGNPARTAAGAAGSGWTDARAGRRGTGAVHRPTPAALHHSSPVHGSTPAASSVTSTHGS